MPGPSPTPPEVFVSYSSKDKRYKESLLKQLRILAQQGVISTWHDGLLTPGQQWNEEIVKHLHSSRVILLLISDDFLVSDYVNNVELKLAAERHRAGKVCVIPVLVRNVNGWKSQPFGSLKLGDFQALPAGEKFIVEWDNRNKAFTEIAQGIQKAVEQLKVTTAEPVSPSTLRPAPVVDFVARTGRDGRDIIERLKEELSPPSKRLVALIGQGGVGKTILAAEVSLALADVFMERIVWASAEKRADFTFSTLLDEIAAQLGDKGLSKLTLTEKEAEVRGLIAAAPALIVLDNFETILTEEQISCADFLAARAQCSALITSRQRVQGARPIYVDSMKPEEAREFLEKLVEQMQDPAVFSAEVRQRIIETADARPYVMQWVTAQIDLEAQEPNVVLEELSQGKGDAAERVFDRSFNLPQLGSDGQDALLALSLFVPSATREALSEVAGFKNDLERTNEAVAKLRALLLIKGTDEYRRLTVEGLTRSLIRARLSKDERVSEFRKRFVTHCLSYAKAHAQPTPEDFDKLEAEKDNLLRAMDVAFDLEDWASVVQIRFTLNEFLDLHGYWDEAIRSGNQALAAARRSQIESLVAGLAHNLAIVHYRRGELESAQRLYDESLEIKKRLGNQNGIAVTLHQLAILAQAQGELEEARRLYDESLEIKKKLGDQNGIAITLHQLGRLSQAQGELEEARRLYNESLEIAKRLGDQSGIAITLHQLGRLAEVQGELEEARRLYDESLEITKRLGDQNGIASALHNLAAIAQAQGEPEEARRLYDESLEIKKRLGNQSGIAVTLHQLGRLAEDENNKVEAARLFREALGIFERLKSPYAEVARQGLERVEREGA
jgi:tetratricopeptide (TPR) repeat protein